MSSPEERQPPRRSAVVLVELIRFVIVVLFTALGYQVSRALVADKTSARIIVGTILGSGIGYVIGGVLGRGTGTLVGIAEKRIASIPGADIVSGGLGLVAGVIVATVPGLFLLLLPSRAVGLPILAFVEVVFGYLGYRIGVTKREDVLQLVGLTYRTRAADLRVLDTSAILNTQLLDYVRAGLIRGTVLVPTTEPAPVSLDDRLRELEISLIDWALNVSGGNKSKAADLLTIKRSTLGDRINRCGLNPAERTRLSVQVAIHRRGQAV